MTRTRAVLAALAAAAVVGIGIGVGVTSGSSGTPAGAHIAGSSSTSTATSRPAGESGSDETGPGAAAAPVTYHGSGDRTVTVRKPGNDPGAPAILYARANGPGRFAVTLLAAGGQVIDTPVQATGGYVGSVLIDFESGSEGSDTHRLRIRAAGPWTIQLRPLSTARRFSDAVRGSGDEVLAFTGTAGTVRIRHARVGGPFLVDVITDPEDEFGLVSATGGFDGTRDLPKGTDLITVVGRGGWSITRA